MSDSVDATRESESVLNKLLLNVELLENRLPAPVELSENKLELEELLLVEELLDSASRTTRTGEKLLTVSMSPCKLK